MPRVTLKILGSVLEGMEDKELDSRVGRTKNYGEILNAFHDVNPLDPKIAERLLAVCVEDLTNDLQYSSSAIMVVQHVLKKVQEGKCIPVPDLLPSALSILEIGKKLLKEPQLRMLTVDTLLAYPDDILFTLATTHSIELIEFLEFNYVQQDSPQDILCKVTKILSKILKMLPPEKKLEFTRNGLNIWFKVVIPKILLLAFEERDALKGNLEGLELLVDAVILHDYADNPFWQNVYKTICDPKKHPLILKNFVETGNMDWHRLWIIFIKLLKDQITKTNGGVSPINALLPVIEMAFKLDINCRCRAFQCWNVLIDNFSAENNEFLVNKRLKLLMIPLKLNNAKVPTTVLAKFDTWWHLIRKFHSKIDKFTDMVLIPFVHFCFGKYFGTLKVSNSPAPGQMSSVTAKQCAEALIEIIGHYNCDGCVTVPRLNGKLISTKLLAEHWNDWVVALCGAVKTLANSDSVHRMQQLMCLWKGFVVTIGELPENQIRADLMNELLKIADDLVEQSKTTDKLDDIVFNVLLISLCDDDPKIKQLLKTKNGSGPIFTILAILQNPLLNRFYMRQDPETLMCKLKRLTNLIMDDTLAQPDEITEWLIKNPPGNESKLMIWAALSESIYESRYNMKQKILCSVVLWPLKTMNSLSDTKSELVWYKWYTLYSYVHPMTNNCSLDSNIASILMGNTGFTPANTYFMLGASLALLKQKLLNDQNAECELEAEILLNVMSNVKEYKSMGKYLPILTDTLVVLLNKVVENVNFKLAEYSIGITTIFSKVIFIHMLKTNNDVTDLTLMESILKPIDALFGKKEYGPLKLTLANTLVESLPLMKTESPLKNSIKSVLKTFLSQIKDSDNQLYKNIKAAVDNAPSNVKYSKQDQNKSSFTAPPPKSAKKSKKKDPNIVNTVVEDGEEFVVVKSNWKFNPKKLTENQKEKLKRKREDIPALYQDLSQSQDEFKLTSWKTDSQDASTTSSSKSNSKTNEDFTDILKNMASTDIVPKIMESIISDTEKCVASDTKQQQSPAVKEPKTPRLALKDRVFRNVRNLIEKSGVQTEVKAPQQITEELNQTVNENDLKTPVSKPKTNANVTNSAPPKIALERPTRSIKKPKKFEDVEVFAIKKKRRLQSGSQDSDISAKSEGTAKDQEVSKDKLDPNKEVQNEDVAKESEQLENDMQEAKVIEPVPVISTETKEDNEKAATVEQVVNSQAHQSPEQYNKKTDIDEKQDDHIDAQQYKVTESTEDQKELNESIDNSSQAIEEISTPKPASKKKESDHSTIKKKRSRIEKQLLIDMVEGHPVLQSQSEKRMTRKNLPNDTVSKRRKSLIEKSNKIKAELGVVGDKKVKGKERSPKSTPKESQPMTVVDESQEKLLESSEDPPMSEDIIESSQDSSITTISVKSATKKKVAVVRLDKENPLAKNKATDTQKLLDDFNNEIVPLADLSNQESKDDIELPKNKTMVEENVAVDLTENMDTEPVDSSGDVIIINDEASPIVINTESSAPVGKETQEMADADTLPMDVDSDSIPSTLDKETTDTAAKETNVDDPSQTDNDITNVTTQEDVTPAMPCTAEVLTDIIAESSNTGSPLKDEVQRKKDFLNDTIEISPIKNMSPIRDKKSPSPETSSDYVVIKLTSPVQSNGEPFNEKCDSPEVFTEDKVSPDKRDQSPPRKEVVTTNSSPSSSLSLKKNRPQMRPNGRAAQMLGLCVPETLQTIISTDRSETEEIKKGTPMNNSSARRNLRILYNSVGDNPADEIPPPVETETNEETESFLKFKRLLPTADCSPSGPILKRKLADIADEATVSPASKRKRVSFHDPPVSTTVSVQKYIEPCGVRSPQSSTLKRQDRQLRALTGMKSPKRLDKVFRLETVLTKTVESFTDEPTISNDTEISLDETPAVEIVKASELNDTDPICPELLVCKDPFENIAGELSSYSTKTLLIKELEGKVETVADLAKMTELEVNRLCIKAPKVKVAKKVLTDYASKRANKLQVNIVDKVMDVPKVLDVEMVNTEVQTNEVSTKSLKTQTVPVAVTLQHTQTDVLPTAHSSVQTDESGNKSTKDVIATCLVERPDFVDQLTSVLEPTSIQRISEKLPFDASLSLLLKKMDFTNTTEVLNQVVAQSVKDNSGNMNLTVLQEYLCKRFASKDLILFCSQLLQKIHDKPS